MKRLESIEIGELERVLAVSGQTMWVVSLEGTILEFAVLSKANEAFREDELLGTPLRSIVHPDDLAGAVEVFESVSGGDTDAEDFEIELRVVGKGGGWHDVRVTGSALVLTDGDEPVVMGLTSDITRQKEAERALHRERIRFLRTFEQAPTGIVLVHVDSERGALIKGVNAEACRMGGRDESDMVGRWMLDGDLTEIDEEAFRESLTHSEALLRGEENGLTLFRILKRPDGTRRNIKIVVSALDAGDVEQGDDPHPINAIAHIEDVTEQRQAEVELQHQARHDSLTDLLNRRRFITLLTDRLERGAKGHGGGCLLMIDLDDFKQVNDEHGHMAGDKVLQEVAGILRGQLRESDPVARLGGDEFAVLLPHTDLVGAARVAESLLECLEKTRIEIVEGKASFMPSVSIGAIMLDNREVDAEAALRECDRAMYEAKRQGGGRFVVATT